MGGTEASGGLCELRPHDGVLGLGSPCGDSRAERCGGAGCRRWAAAQALGSVWRTREEVNEGQPELGFESDVGPVVIDRTPWKNCSTWATPPGALGTHGRHRERSGGRVGLTGASHLQGLWDPPAVAPLLCSWGCPQLLCQIGRASGSEVA